jgi:hypothetical protein
MNQEKLLEQIRGAVREVKPEEEIRLNGVAVSIKASPFIRELIRKGSGYE